MPIICWKCQEELSSNEDFREHLLREHVENVDYIRCPACDKLVLDLFIHYQNCHSGLDLPTDRPLRVGGKIVDHKSIWLKKEKSRKKKGQFRTGTFKSIKNGTDIHYRSSWELAVYKILEKSFAVKAYKGEPFPIPYVVHGKVRNYWPDIWVQFTDNTVMLIEVKPLAQCPGKDGNVNESASASNKSKQAVNKAKWEAANAYCEKKKWSFVVWTERAIKQLGIRKSDMLTKSELMKSDGGGP